jgi:hypothetical protein
MPGKGAIALQRRKMPRHGAFGDAGDLGELSHRREAPAGAIRESNEALQRPAQVWPDRAVHVKDNRDIGKHLASACSSTAPEALDLGTLCRCTPKGLLRSAFSGKLSAAMLIASPVRRIADPPLRRVLLLGFWVSRPRVKGTERAGNPRATQSLRQRSARVQLGL